MSKKSEFFSDKYQHLSHTTHIIPKSQHMLFFFLDFSFQNIVYWWEQKESWKHVMARQKEFNQSHVIERAMQLFWEQGYERTSVEDLVRCTGLGRGSLYDTFHDKHSLFLLALNHYQEEGRKNLVMLREAQSPFLEALRHFFAALIDETTNDTAHRGCMMVNTTLEVAPHDPAVAAVTQVAISEAEEAFYHVLIKAQAAGELAWTYDPHQLAHFLLNTMLGIRVLARTNPSRHMLEEIVTTAFSVFR